MYFPYLYIFHINIIQIMYYAFLHNLCYHVLKLKNYMKGDFI